MRLTRHLLKLPFKAAEKFSKYAFFSPTSLSLKDMSKPLDIVKSTCFLRVELPVRVANILKEIHLLPKVFLETPSASLVTGMYEDLFCGLMRYEDKGLTEKDCLEYLAYLDKSFQRHDNVVETMARGVIEMQQIHDEDAISNSQIQYFLDRFYMMRIGMRMLISQHLLLFSPEFKKASRVIGCVDPNCDVVEILKDAYTDAKHLCSYQYADTPDMQIELCNAVNGHVKFVYVPSHLHYILFELLKNSMRAVVERHRMTDESSLPPIQVLITDGTENVTVRVSDRGGGFPRSHADLLFRYAYTTAGGKDMKPSETSPSGHSRIAGYGYGLPLSRLYARYLRGDLMVTGLEGHGTDAHLFLMRRETDADELLPVFNRTAARRYESTGVPVCDWSH